MFKKVLCGVALFASISTGASAALLSRAGGQAYYDTVLDITWLADTNYAQTSGYDGDGLMTWSQSQTWIDSLNTASHLGVSDWRLPTTLQPDSSCQSQYNPGTGYPLQGWGRLCTGSEMGHLVNVNGIDSFTPGPFLHIPQAGGYYWSGTEYTPNTDPYGQGSANLNSAWSHGFSSNAREQAVAHKNSFSYAWAVLDGDIGAQSSVIPIPAAAWLFGGALGVLGLIRRRQATA